MIFFIHKYQKNKGILTYFPPIVNTNRTGFITATGCLPIRLHTVTFVHTWLINVSKVV